MILLLVVLFDGQDIPEKYLVPGSRVFHIVEHCQVGLSEVNNEVFPGVKCDFKHLCFVDVLSEITLQNVVLKAESA